MFLIPVIRFLVVCGFFETIEIFLDKMEFKRVDFPALGLPMIEIKPDLQFLSLFIECIDLIIALILCPTVWD